MATIGFIGLGIMGKPMARNLIKAGYPLVVHNRSRGAVEELSKEGAQTAASPEERGDRLSVESRSLTLTGSLESTRRLEGFSDEVKWHQ